MILGHNTLGLDTFANTNSSKSNTRYWTQVCKPKTDWVKFPRKLPTIKRCK